ncbi:protein Abitram-like [Rhopilema esculentum]|uniref:protein Abitram-like n=1 Tax=Rhopilema esculentum TaxID=499914 RepID=UPI0031D653FA
MSSSRVYQTIVQRYFTSHFFTDVMGKALEDQLILQHSNKICIITAAPSHKLFQDGEILSVNFQIKGRKDRTENKVSGKSKRGGQQLEYSSVLCEVECASGSKYLLRSCIQGKLIEINEELIENPQLLLESPENGGYIAIVLPRLKPIEEISKNVLSSDQYQEVLRDRTRPEI